MLVAGSGASHDIEPYCFVDEKSRKYIEEFLGMTVQEYAAYARNSTSTHVKAFRASAELTLRNEIY